MIRELREENERLKLMMKDYKPGDPAGKSMGIITFFPLKYS
jgi:hypothetical protein